MNKFLIILFIVLSCSTAHTQQSFIEQVIKDINNRSLKAVQQSCSPGFWDLREGDSAANFYRQVSHPKYGMTLQLDTFKMSRDKKRTVVLVNLYSPVKKRVVDQVFLYLELIDGSWKWGGIDETREHIQAFLSGKVPATFVLRSYPSSTKLKHWAQDFLGKYNTASTWEEKINNINPLVESGKKLEGSDWHQIRDYPSLIYKSNYWVESLNRGAVVFEGINPDYPDYADTVCLYLERTDTGWRFIRTTGYPSSSAILRDQED